MNSRCKRALLPTLIIAFVAYQASSQIKNTPSSTASPKSPVRELVITFDSADLDEANGLAIYKKAVLIDGDTILHADELKVHRQQKTCDASGNLLITDPQADITGEKATLNYTRSMRTAILTGSVKIILKPRKAAPTPAPVSVTDNSAKLDNSQDTTIASARQNPAIITCDKVVYQYAKEKKQAVLTGAFKVVQKLSDRSRTLTAEHADWFGNDEKVILYAPVHLEDTRGFSGDSAENVTVYTADGKESVKLQKGKATLPVDDEEDLPKK